MAMEFDDHHQVGEELDPDEGSKKLNNKYFTENAYNGLNQELYVISEEDATSYKETLYSERERQNSIALQGILEDPPDVRHGSIKSVTSSAHISRRTSAKVLQQQLHAAVPDRRDRKVSHKEKPAPALDDFAAKEIDDFIF